MLPLKRGADLICRNDWVDGYLYAYFILQYEMDLNKYWIVVV